MAPNDLDLLLQRVADGHTDAFGELLAQYRMFLLQTVQLRMDERLAGRIDASDVVQDAFVQAVSRISDYLDRRPMPFRVWLRQTTLECLLVQHRRHLGAKIRAVRYEVRLPDRSSAILAAAVLGSGKTGSEHVAGAELAEQVRAAVGELSETHREIILLRIYEGLTNQEAACVLNIDPDAARKRYTRALLRLREILVNDGLRDTDR